MDESKRASPIGVPNCLDSVVAVLDSDVVKVQQQQQQQQQKVGGGNKRGQKQHCGTRGLEKGKRVVGGKASR